ncbi:hypothetical protein NUS45_04545, partial [Glaesserella parasuis]|nr:hypothetical protein [Glaesserella parasuis]
QAKRLEGDACQQAKVLHVVYGNTEPVSEREEGAHVVWREVQWRDGENDGKGEAVLGLRLWGEAKDLSNEIFDALKDRLVTKVDD